MTGYCQLARQAIQMWLTQGKKVSPTSSVGHKAACFVSLHAQNGDLRGCIGTLAPNQADLALEIVENAIAAATRDPRFPPLSLEDLPQITIDVSVLAEPESIPNDSFLDPARFGVIVSSGSKRGVLLPGLDGISKIEDQVRIAKQKARIYDDEPVELERFEVTWHDET